MLRTRLTNEIFHGDSSVSSYPWLSLLDAVNWKISQIKKVKISVANSLYYSIIIDFAGIIEGFINHVLDSTLEARTTTTYDSEEILELLNKEDLDEEIMSGKDEFIGRLFDHIKDKIQNASWIGYNDIFKLIFNKDIQKTIKPETWRSINSLFIFRNMIIHGKILTFNYNQIANSDEYSISVENKYQKVYTYLSECKLIDAGPTGYVDIISERIIMHYYQSMNNFIREIIKNIDNDNDKNKVIEIFILDPRLMNLYVK